MENNLTELISSNFNEMTPIEDKDKYVKHKVDDRLNNLVELQSSKLDKLLEGLLNTPIDFDNLGRMDKTIKSVGKIIQQDMKGVMGLYALSNLYSQDTDVIYDRLKHLFNK